MIPNEIMTAWGRMKKAPGPCQGTRALNSGEVTVDIFNAVTAEKQPQQRQRAGAQRNDAAEARRWLNDHIARAKKVGMYSEVAELTPAIARALLDHHNTRNRPMRPTRAAFFTRVINDGQWLLTSQGVSVAIDGVLNNGQHRCAGVVIADTSVPMMFTFGEVKDAFSVIDTQATRGASDALAIEGEQNVSGLAAACRLLSMIETGAARHNVKMTIQDVRNVLAAHPGLREAVTAGHRFNASIKRTSTAGGAVAFYQIMTQSSQAARLPDFWDRLCLGTGMDAKRDPILTLRNGLINQTLNMKRGHSGAPIAAAIINAWNLWTAGKQAISVSWRDGTDFPEVR